MAARAWLLGAFYFHFLTCIGAVAPSFNSSDDGVHRSGRGVKLLRAASLSTSDGTGVAGRKLPAASCGSYSITSGYTTNTIQWDGGGGADKEWLNVDNWATAHLPGTNKFNRLIMAGTSDQGTVHCPATYMTHDVELEMRTYATLDVQADLNIGDELYLKNSAKLTQSGQSVVTIGKRLYLAAYYEMSEEAQLVVEDSIYFPLTGSLTIKGEDSSVSVAPASPNDTSQVHGVLKYVMGASGVGSLTFNGSLVIGSGARLIIDASLYTAGAATITLITFSSSTGSFESTYVTTAPVVTGLAAGLTSEIKTLADGVYLEISQHGVPPPPPPAPTPEPPSPIATALPTKQPSPSPTQCHADSDCDDKNGCTLNTCHGDKTCHTVNACGADEVCSNQQCVAAPTTSAPTTSAPTRLPTTTSPTAAPIATQTAAPVPLTASPTGAPVTPQTSAPVPLPTDAPVSTPTTSSPISSTTTVVTMGAIGVVGVTPAQPCPGEITEELLIDGDAYQGGEGTFTLFECPTGVGFDVMKIRLINFPKQLGLWFEIKENLGNVELMIKSLANYSEYLYENGYEGQYNFQAVDNQEHFPGFSWNKVSKWISYKVKGGNKRMSDTIINWIADNNYISWYGLLSDADLIDTARRIRVRNPNYKQILYWNSFGIWWKLVGTIYDPYPGFKDEWYKRLPNGNYETDTNGNRRLYDHSNPDFRAWWINHALSMNSNEWISGVFSDATRSPEGTDHSNMIEELQNKLPEDAIKLGNFLRQTDSAWNGNRYRLEYSDGSYLENVHHGRVGQTNEYGKGQPLIASMQLAREALWKGKIIMWNGAPFNCNVFGIAPIDRIKGRCEATISQGEMDELIKPTLAEYLIVAEKFAYFNFMVTQIATEEGRHMWETSQMAEFQRPLGEPLGPPVKVGDKFSRHFEHVKVMLTVGADGVNQGSYEWDSA